MTRFAAFLVGLCGGLYILNEGYGTHRIDAVEDWPVSVAAEEWEELHLESDSTITFDSGDIIIDRTEYPDLFDPGFAQALYTRLEQTT
jgi:hypothetical protein